MLLTFITEFKGGGGDEYKFVIIDFILLLKHYAVIL